MCVLKSRGDHYNVLFSIGCRAKFHKEHVTNNGEGVTPCKVNYDPTTAKEMLLMATSYEEQQLWVARLLKRIQKSGFKASGGEGSRISPQESMRSTKSLQNKAATLPAAPLTPSSSTKNK